MVVANILVSSTSVVFADIYDGLMDPGVGGFVTDQQTDPGFTFVDYNLNGSGNYNDLNNNSFNFGTTYFGSTNCIGCDSIPSVGYSFVDYNLNSSGNYNNLNNNSFPSGTTYYGSTNCIGCDSTYTTPVVTNTSTFTPVDTSYYGGNSYGTNSYGAVNYGSTNYGYTSYGQTNYGQTGSSWTGVNSCPAGQSLINGSCQTNTLYCPMDAKICPDGSSVGRTLPGCNFAACPTLNPIVCQMDSKQCSDGSFVFRTLPNCAFQACPTPTPVPGQCVYPGYTMISGGLCQKTCPNGTVVTYPNDCQAPITCSTGTYLFNGSCTPCPTGVAVSPGPAGCPATPITPVTCPTGLVFVNGTCVFMPTICPIGVDVSPGNPACQTPNPVCPIGSTLVNGTCQINTTTCPAGSTLINGTCQINTTVCPANSTLINGVCQAPIVCPTGTTLQNGACIGYGTTVCPIGSTLVNGVCQINNTACPAGSTLINGICQINSTVCPAGATLINGVCQVNQTTCPAGSTLVNGVCQINQTVCPANSTLINGVCQAPITCPTGTNYQNGHCVGYGTTVCPIGSTLINNVCQINQTTCPSGSSFINGVCQAPITCPSGTSYQNGSCVNNQVMVTCPNGSVVNYLFQCPVTYGQTSYGQTSYAQTNYNIPQVVYQTCWDGTVLPNTSVCPSQYKMCANGTSIPINQTCYVAPLPVYVPPVVIKFNNVVTSVVTQVTNNSARCNGIGLIAQGAQSTGWFEYGQTANLGRTTSPAIIGSSATAPFSNVLSNLQPSTAYYCRAVMQNEYGVVKGEIVKFTTKAKASAVVYAQPTPVKTSVKKVVKKNEIVCFDGSVVSTGNESSATMLNQGQKLIAVQMEKITGDLMVGGNVSYKLSYKNLVGANLSGVIIKIAIPEEISLTDVPMGSYDEATHTMTFNQLSVNPYSENVINWSGTVKKTASVGKTIVTTAYVLYTVPGTQVQDEVTAYTASSISQAPDIQTQSGSKKVVGAGVGSFLPNSLVEWLALIAILFIIFILGRSIAASYRKGDEAHH